MNNNLMKMSNAFWCLFLFIIFSVSGCGGGGGGGGGQSNNPPPSETVSAPDAPSNVVATEGDAQVSIKWDDALGATSYNLYWATESGVDISDNQITGIASPYIHTGLTNGTTYYYVVTAVNMSGESIPSVEVSATPAIVVPEAKSTPNAPANVVVIPGDRQITIKWDAVDGAGFYNIYWGEGDPVAVQNNKIGDVQSPYVHTGLINGMPYFYVLKAVNEIGEGEASTEAYATPLFQGLMLTATGAEYGDGFGFSVSFDGNYAVMGAPYRDPDPTYALDTKGAAYMYFKEGATWSEAGILGASDAKYGDSFGDAASISGDYVVVGAPLKDGGVNHWEGAIYVFHRQGAAWIEEAKLLASDGDRADFFGDSVAIDGDYIVIGAPGEDDGGSRAGAAYIYHRGVGGWGEEVKLIASDAKKDDEFGQGVSIIGDIAAISTYTDNGAVYIFRRVNGNWVEEQKITASDTVPYDGFGTSVSIANNYLVVGAPYAGNGIDGGAAYIFNYTNGIWQETQKITAFDAAGNDEFGDSVSISGDYIIVGSPLEDGGYNDPLDDSGAVYIFHREGDEWIANGKFLAADAQSYDYYGYPVSIDDGTVIFGAFGEDGVTNRLGDQQPGAGAVYIYKIY